MKNRDIVPLVLAAGAFLCCGCASVLIPDIPPVAPAYSAIDAQKPVAFVNAVIIDGTGSESVRGGTILFGQGIITAVGRAEDVALPAGCQVFDMEGATVLPGVVNAHVHNAYDEANAAYWAYCGVTTVRDLSCSAGEVESATAFRDRSLSDPGLALVVSSGALITAPGGYESLYGIAVNSPEKALTEVDREIDAGVDFVKIILQKPAFLQPGGVSTEIAGLIVGRAHEAGVPVTAHVATTDDLTTALDCGVDDIAHIVSDELTSGLVERIVNGHVPVELTLTLWENSRGRKRAVVLSNAMKLVDAGAIVALGCEYVASLNTIGPFVGMPVTEFRMMREAGMTPMQIVVAATLNAARACRLDARLGSLEAGKRADILVLDGDPLSDLDAFTRVKIVVHGGTVIRG
jgi:imidazolonepropionase-like amidohydrolase